MKCISEKEFKITADQKYGPITTRRRGLALRKRKELKAQGVIAGGYVKFPARLMVNLPGNVDVEGRKIYTMHTDFSQHGV